MDKKPPKFATRLLKWFCNVEFLEEIEGDLNEQFAERLQKHGLWKANWHYLQDVLNSIRSYPIHRNESKRYNRLSYRDLAAHFFKITFRNILRSKSTAFINISGLAISLASFMLIGIYLIDEATFDSFHEDASDIYRISYSYGVHGDGIIETDARAAGLWSVALKESMPAVKAFTRFSRFGYPGKVRYEKLDKTFVEQQFFWVDTTYANIFTLQLIKGGDPTKVLRNHNNVIITERVATKYFGEGDPIGEILIYNRDGIDLNLTVAGVMKAYPTNSHFHPDFIASNIALQPLWKASNEDRVNSWGDAFTYSYVKVEKGTDASQIFKGVRAVFDKHLGEDAKRVWPVIIPLTDIHFTTGMRVDLETPGERINLYILGSIGMLILLIASINYMNLATARSITRSKEVGLRKTLGVTKTTLVAQFLGESILVTCISVMLSILLLSFLLPYFNDLTGKDFSFLQLLDKQIFIPLLGITLVIGIISGTYPAFYLSSFDPVRVLKGNYQGGAKAENVRKALVVLQFSVTMLLIVGALVIDGQLNFINSTKLNEYKDNILMVRLFGIADLSKTDNLKSTITQDPSVDDVSFGTQVPRQDGYGWIDTRLKVPALSTAEHIWQQLDVDFNFPAMFNLELISGRTFSEAKSDSAYVLVNESALKDLNISPEKAIGLVLENAYDKKQRTIIGIVKDFSYASVRQRILPLMINLNKENAETMYVKLDGTDYPEIIESLYQKWRTIYPQTPFEYWFLSEEFTRLYKVERQTSTILKYFTILAIAIGCLGLFGLASFTAEQRTKEIGIRKVLGASSGQIVLLLSSGFMKLIVVSFLIGIPLSYFLIHRWLENFAYQIEFGLMFFVVSASVILLLTCVTVGIESLRAALANPAESIRHE